ncbi:Protein of unknown function [Formosa sp. Hel1_31_208]|uniref:DUF262 domain-containing protein n=1 Tax=Formosa sp. Hel1_31_208 TaxID=1798225 RepID=UPI00087A09D7|nr:DUF262 domain-containing protein [Formosa sp. Hel1_31_208]SDR90573.1 Protein of unknown function [Formosa sp. Hel1_31_208]
MKELESLNKIFKDGIFKIPDYQRGYAWSTKQLKDFWEDIINLPDNKMHYTGVLTLKRVEEHIWRNWNDEGWLIRDRDYTPYHIVDGQQRLTTVVIFIQALIEVVTSLPENKDKNDSDIYLGSFSIKQIKETYLVISKPPQFIINTYMFSYEVDNPSFKYLKHKILNEPSGGEIGETFYTLNLENAKVFFKDNLKHVLEEYGIEEIESLYRKVTQNLKFNKYEIGDDFDVYVAFETMNNRGKQLSNLELLKNRLIYLTTLYDKSELKNDDRNALREKINDAWKGIYHQIGRNKKKPLNDDDFLVAHWIMYFQYTRQKGDDYIKFLLGEKFTPKNIFSKIEVDVSDLEIIEEVKEEIIDDDDDDDVFEEENGTKSVAKLRPKEIEEYVSSLKEVAAHWYNTNNPLNNPDLTDKESIWLDRLNRVGIVYFRPLVTVSFIAKGVTSSDRVKLFKQIERFIFIIFRMGRAFSTYRNSEFYKAARQLRVGETTIDEIIETLEERMHWSFYQYEDDGPKHFDYVHFQKYLQKKFQGGGGFYSWNGLKYFLYEYELEKVKQRGNQKIDWSTLFVKDKKDKVSVEHILPQTPSKDCWKNVINNFNEKELGIITNSLGNLVPLSMSINASLQNDCFADKKVAKFDSQDKKIRMGYNDGSHSEIEVAAHDNWTAQNILQRGLTLLTFLENRWDVKFESREGMLELLFLKFLEEPKGD